MRHSWRTVLRRIRRSEFNQSTYNTRYAHSQAPRNVIDELEARGFVAALTSPQIRQLVTSPTCIYSGVDPSASSLHVGNLLPLLGLLHFQAAGHQALALIGGATGSIGDPSGRSTERNSLSPDELDKNVRAITTQVHRFFDRGMGYISRKGYDRKGKGREVDDTLEVKVLNNLDWFGGIRFLDFLRDVGKFARVNVMLSRDSVKNRLVSESGISFTEFSYQLLQAYDFNHLHRTQNCRIQLGGSDQWGNIVAGIDLIKRTKPSIVGATAIEGQDSMEKDKEEAFGLTIPLLTTSSGEKFGKSAGNAVWLDETRTSVSDFYQFFLRATDADVEQYLKLLTLLPLEDIDQVIKQHQSEPEKRSAQKLLADEITELVHGEQAVIKAQTVASVLFSTSLSSLKVPNVLTAFENDPRLQSIKSSEAFSVPLTKLVANLSLVKSRAEAGRIVQSGGFYLNDKRMSDPAMILGQGDLIDGALAVIRTGKTSHLILHVETDS